MILIAGYLAWRSRRSPRMQLALVLLFVAALLSLGPYLSVRGRTTHFPLPFLVLGHLPLFDNILPSRISFGMDAFLAAVIAFGLDDMRGAGVRSHPTVDPEAPRSRERVATLVAVVTLVVVVATLLPKWPYAKLQAAGLPKTVRSVIPAGDPITVTYPYAYFPVAQPLLWQAQSDFAFRTTGGYGITGRRIERPPRGRSPTRGSSIGQRPTAAEH